MVVDPNFSMGVKLDFSDGDGPQIWNDGREKRASAFIDLCRTTVEKSFRSIEMLEGVLADSPEKVRVGKNHIIVLGNIASYCLPLESIVDLFARPFKAAGQGIPSVEVHPKDRWVRRPSTACIQSRTDREATGLDDITALVLGLTNDDQLVQQAEHTPLRTALVHTYGFIQSPLTPHLDEYLANQYGAEHDIEAGLYTVPGTDGWMWQIEYRNPEMKGFRICARIKGGPVREIHADFGRRTSWYESIDKVMDLCSTSPRGMLDDSRHAPWVMELVWPASTYWKPLRDMILELYPEGPR